DFLIPNSRRNLIEKRADFIRREAPFLFEPCAHRHTRRILGRMAADQQGSTSEKPVNPPHCATLTPHGPAKAGHADRKSHATTAGGTLRLRGRSWELRSKLAEDFGGALARRFGRAHTGGPCPCISFRRPLPCRVDAHLAAIRREVTCIVEIVKRTLRHLHVA